MRKAAILLALILGLTLAGACAAGKAPAPYPTPTPTPTPTPIPRPIPTPAFEGPAGPSGLPSMEERLIVRTGGITLLVENVVEAMDQVAKLAEGLGGYVVSSERLGEGEILFAIVVLRVPAEKFDEAIRALRDLAVRVTAESTMSQDVTEEYIDFDSRLRNLEATESQLLKVLERATEVSDIVEVVRELSKIRSEIEQVKGRIAYLERTSQMARLSVELRPATSPAPLVKPGWSAGETLKKAVRGLTEVGQWLADIGLWLLVFSPLWLAILLIVFWRWRRRTKRA